MIISRYYCFELVYLIMRWKCYTKDEYYEKMIKHLSSKHTTREELESWTFINNIINISDPWGGYDKPINAYSYLFKKLRGLFSKVGGDTDEIEIQIICDDRLEK